MRISDWSSDVCSSDLFPVMRSDGGRGEDVGQTVSSCRIDLVEEQRSFLEATPESKGTIACGRFEERVLRADSCGLRHQDRQSVVLGTSVSVSVDLGVRCILTKTI